MIPYEVAEFPGRTFYQNAGETLRKGIEFDFNYRLSKKFSTSIVYNYANFKYDEYTLDGLNLKRELYARDSEEIWELRIKNTVIQKT